MQIIKGIEQGSDEWLDLRKGYITASNFSKVLAGGEGKTRKSYMVQLAGEIITGLRAESYTNTNMQWGNDTEPQARMMYELQTGLDVDEVTFVIWRDGRKIGISPDGLIGSNGGVEIKCPKTSTHIETYLSGKMPACHKHQVQGSLWVTGREWWDFVSFDPRINGSAGLFIERQYRDDKYIDKLEAACIKFEVELDAMVSLLSDG